VGPQDQDPGVGDVAAQLHARAAHHLVELLWACDLVDDSVLRILEYPLASNRLLQVDLASSASGPENPENPEQYTLI